jgi:hypothetical protein
MSSKYRSSVSTRLQPDTDDLQKWTSFQHVVKVQVLCVNQAASGYRRPAKKGLVFSMLGFLRRQNIVFCVNQAASGYRRPAKNGLVFSMLGFCVVSASLHPDIDDLQKFKKKPPEHVQKVPIYYYKHTKNIDLVTQSL